MQSIISVAITEELVEYNAAAAVRKPRYERSREPRIFLPGDVADDGSRSAYAVVRGELDRLKVPWCAIIGDHDIHEKSFANFKEAMSEQTHYAFTVGDTRFLAMNAFDVPVPPDGDRFDA